MSVAMPLTTLITGVSKQSKAKMLTAQLGNGYIHTAVDGPSNLYELLSITWSNLSLTDRDTVVAAIVATYAVDYFTYTPPGDSSKKYIIVPSSDADLYSESVLSGRYYSISINVRQIK
jgi:phage-related protein